MLKIYRSRIAEEATTDNISSEQWRSDGKTYLHLLCGDKRVAMEEVQLEGKKRIGIEEFLRGYRFN